MNSATNQHGFTLVELLVYGAGLLIILAGIVAFLFYLLSWYRQATIPTRIDQTGIALITQITNDLRGASSVDTSKSTLGNKNGAIYMTTTYSTYSTTTKYYLSSGKILESINGGSAITVSPDDIWISGFYVNQPTTTNATDIRLEIDIDYLLKTSTSTATTTNYYYDLAILRQSYQ